MIDPRKNSDASRDSPIDLAIVFLRLGTTAFGGPAAHIAMMRSEFVDRRGWFTDAEFLDLVGACNLIPGPSSTELAIFIGMRRAGWIGFLAAGVCFILPATLIVCAIAAAYTRYGHVPQMAGILYGIKPVIIAIVAQAIWMLGKSAISTPKRMAVMVAVLALSFTRMPPAVLLFGTGALTGVRAWLLDRRSTTIGSLRPIATAAAVLVAVPVVLAAVQPTATSAARPFSLFLVFAKIGSLVYGSGYVLLAFLRTDLVNRLHWLTSSTLLDAVAVGQFTPGPVFTTATFIGYKLAGPIGALAATLGIFLPAFAYVGVWSKFASGPRQSKLAAAFLDGVNCAALALMTFVTYQLARAALVDGLTVAIAVAGAIVLFRLRINSAWTVLAGAIIGFIAHHP